MSIYIVYNISLLCISLKGTSLNLFLSAYEVSIFQSRIPEVEVCGHRNCTFSIPISDSDGLLKKDMVNTTFVQ